jgi:hypothetical protein
MKHIKAIFEYEDKEIMDLLGDMETVGQGPMKGWLILMTNMNGLTTGEIVIADDWKEAQTIYYKNSPLGQVIGQAAGLGSSLAALKKNSSLVAWDIVDGFKAKVYTKGYKRWNTENPYITVEILDTFFTNSKVIMNNMSVNSPMVPPGIAELKKA